MNQETKAKGISLIVLVITIIIIIILAGAVILSLNNSGIISKAKLAKESNDLVAIREAVETEKANGMFENATVSYSSIVPASYANDIEVLQNGTILLKYNANTKITDIGSAVDKLGAIYIPKGFTVSYATGENTKEGGLVIYETATQTTDSNLSTQQTSYNQFVWVPVDLISGGLSVKDYGKGSTYIADQGAAAMPTAMSESIAKYKGFYIARYEAGKPNINSPEKDGSFKPFSIKGAYPWNYIGWESQTYMGDPGESGFGNSDNPRSCTSSKKFLYRTKL